MFVNTCSREAGGREPGGAGAAQPEPPSARDSRLRRGRRRRDRAGASDAHAAPLARADAVLRRGQGDQPRGRAPGPREDGRSLPGAPGHLSGLHQHALRRGALAGAIDAARGLHPGVARARRCRGTPRPSSTARSASWSPSWSTPGGPSISPRSGNPMYEKPAVLVIYREDCRFLLDQVIPFPGGVRADYDLVIASHPYRARASTEFKARKVITPLTRSLAAGGRLIGIHACGGDPGMEIVQQVWPGEDPFVTNRHDLLRTVKNELGQQACPLQLLRLVGRQGPVPAPDAHPARRDRSSAARRSAPRRCSRPGTRRPTTPRSRTTGCPPP